MRTHRLLIGTHTSNSANEYLQIATITLPNPPAATLAEYNAQTEELGGYGAAKEPINFAVIQKILHPGEVNKARYQPQNPNIIATWARDHNVYVWDRVRIPEESHFTPSILTSVQYVHRGGSCASIRRYCAMSPCFTSIRH